MRSARIAEWILALFLEHDRAAAYTGDLMEGIADRGPIWFWSCVARIAIMRFWYDIAESPFFLAGVLLRAWILNITLTGLTIVGSSILLFPIALLAGLLHSSGAAWQLPGVGEQIARWLGFLLGFTLVFLVSLYTGRWIAGKMPRREISACVAMCLAEPLFYNLIGVVVIRIWGPQLERYALAHAADNSYAPELPANLFLVLGYIGYVAGGIRIRLRGITQ